MKRELNDNEQEYIDNLLDDNSNVDVTKDGVNKKVKPKTKKVPLYKNATHWIGAFILLPVLLSMIIIIGTLRTEAYLGGAIDWLKEQDLDGAFYQNLSNSEMNWMPMFIEIYSYRWLVIVGIFVVCFTIAGIIMFIDRKNNPLTEEELAK